MAQRTNVPTFGSWENKESEDDVPYTVYFEKARKKKGERMINPNDPQENPNMFGGAIDPSPVPAPAPAPPSESRTRREEPIGRGSVRQTPDRKVSGEDGDFRQFSNSPARGENMGGGRGGRRPGTPTRPGAGSEQSSERSPLHPHHQGKEMGRSSGFNAPEGRSHDGSHGTPARSRLRPAARGVENPDEGAAIPKFGEWEHDPQAAENLTEIFNRVREEKNAGAGNVSRTPGHPSSTPRRQQSDEQKKCCVIL